MIAERRLGILEPGENPAVAVIEGAVACREPEARNDLLDELAFAVGRERRSNFLVIENPRGDQRLGASIAV